MTDYGKRICYLRDVLHEAMELADPIDSVIAAHVCEAFERADKLCKTARASTRST